MAIGLVLAVTMPIMGVGAALALFKPPQRKGTTYLVALLRVPASHLWTYVWTLDGCFDFVPCLMDYS